jgi:hypothetical protein
MGLKRGPLSLVSINEEILEINVATPVYKTEINDRGGSAGLITRHPSIRKSWHNISPTNGGRSVGIVLLRTKGHTIKQHTEGEVQFAILAFTQNGREWSVHVPDGCWLKSLCRFYHVIERSLIKNGFPASNYNYCSVYPGVRSPGLRLQIFCFVGMISMQYSKYIVNTRNTSFLLQMPSEIGFLWENALGYCFTNLKIVGKWKKILQLQFHSIFEGYSLPLPVTVATAKTTATTVMMMIIKIKGSAIRW